ncbi:rhomboid family intramembrane serine protease [Parafrankia discariae]|uniref:rhomboid family intramembrane serine protease n=1 Tax=Parafrankia discariae TaxID=365528 RepID=UPI001E3B5879|nr:rhomboid family intramembrane serine protease [Parafrankia discariae]
MDGPVLERRSRQRRRPFGGPQVPSPIGVRPDPVAEDGARAPAARRPRPAAVGAGKVGAGKVPRRPASAGSVAVRGGNGVTGWVGAHPVAFGLIGAGVLLVASALVGALDLFAVGAVLGFWTLIAATGLVLGRPGVDWQVPTEELRAGARRAAVVGRREAGRAARGLARTGGRTARRVENRARRDRPAGD